MSNIQAEMMKELFESLGFKVTSYGTEEEKPKNVRVKIQKDSTQKVEPKCFVCKVDYSDEG